MEQKVDVGALPSFRLKIYLISIWNCMKLPWKNLKFLPEYLIEKMDTVCHIRNTNRFYTIFVYIFTCRGSRNNLETRLFHNTLTGLNDKNFWLAVQVRTFIEGKVVLQFVDIDMQTVRARDSTLHIHQLFFCKKACIVLRVKTYSKFFSRVPSSP